jgi:hypothetical protein
VALDLYFSQYFGIDPQVLEVRVELALRARLRNGVIV